jgi:hypothetical protein
MYTGFVSFDTDNTGGQGYKSTNQTNHSDAQVQNTMTLLIQLNWLLAIVHSIPDVAQG